MAKKRTHEEFLKIVTDFDVLDEFEITGKYVNNATKINIFHKKCNREFSIVPRDFTRRKRCSLCNKKIKLTTKDFKEHIRKIDGEEYSLLSEYVSDSKKVKLKHNECGHVWDITPSHYKQGKRCPKCRGVKKKTTIEFKQEMKNIIGDQYILLEEYKGANKKIKIMHNSSYCDNHIYETTPSNIKRGRGCPKCAILKRSGEKHFNYNSKLTDEDRKNDGRHSLKYKKWRNKVFQIFEYKCDCCGVKGGNLNSHHLNSWNTHIEERYDVKNGVSLCVECHVKFHSIYGFGYNTKEQYYNFKNNYSC